VPGRDRGAQLVHFIDGAADAPMPQYRLDGSVLASRNKLATIAAVASTASGKPSFT